MALLHRPPPQEPRPDRRGDRAQDHPPARSGLPRARSAPGWSCSLVALAAGTALALNAVRPDRVDRRRATRFVEVSPVTPRASRGPSGSPSLDGGPAPRCHLPAVFVCRPGPRDRGSAARRDQGYRRRGPRHRDRSGEGPLHPPRPPPRRRPPPGRGVVAVVRLRRQPARPARPDPAGTPTTSPSRPTAGTPTSSTPACAEGETQSPGTGPDRLRPGVGSPEIGRSGLVLMIRGTTPSVWPSCRAFGPPSPSRLESARPARPVRSGITEVARPPGRAGPGCSARSRWVEMASPRRRPRRLGLLAARRGSPGPRRRRRGPRPTSIGRGLIFATFRAGAASPSFAAGGDAPLGTLSIRGAANLGTTSRSASPMPRAEIAARLQPRGGAST